MLSKLARPPIVEAVIDFDCDLPPAFDIEKIEATARARYESAYPRFRKGVLQEHEIKASVDSPPEISMRRAVQSLLFLHDDEKQLVQVRHQGFSFNRLAPYSSLDDYLPEIENTWRTFAEIILPVSLKEVRLRYINRVLLPLDGGTVDLDLYLKVGPRLPDSTLRLGSFLTQQSILDPDTGHEVNLVLAGQAENDKFPIILDIGVTSRAAADPNDWPKLRSKIESLRSLKNRIFFNMLTERCLALFR
jgi:uncharacterized protein (TIGR04255 family)